LLRFFPTEHIWRSYRVDFGGEYAGRSLTFGEAEKIGGHLSFPAGKRRGMGNKGDDSHLGGGFNSWNEGKGGRISLFER